MHPAWRPSLQVSGKFFVKWLSSMRNGGEPKTRVCDGHGRCGGDRTSKQQRQECCRTPHHMWKRRDATRCASYRADRDDRRPDPFPLPTPPDTQSSKPLAVL